jgi:hypothetical protein
MLPMLVIPFPKRWRVLLLWWVFVVQIKIFSLGSHVPDLLQIPSNTQGDLKQPLAPVNSAKGQSDEQREMMQKWRGLTTAGKLYSGVLYSGVSFNVTALKQIVFRPHRWHYGDSYARWRGRHPHC